MRPEYCLVFICQFGELEVKSLLLAASLRKFLAGDFELVAAVPTPSDIWGELSETTKDLMSQLDVRLVQIENPISPKYPMLNKLAALAVDTSAAKTIYLDADILCVQPFDLHKAFSREFCVKPTDLQTYSMDIGVWSKIYSKVDLQPPSGRVLSTVDHSLMLPYFNSGVVATQKAKELAQQWTEVCQLIIDDSTIEDTEYWVCQLALPVAAKKIGLEYSCLDEKFNYPVNCKPIFPGDLPFLVHYKNTHRLRAEPYLVRLIQSLVRDYPGLKQLIARHDDWRPLLTRRPVVELNNKRDFIITGIPRSGTSLLCNLLHNQENTVVINEPRAVFSSLPNQSAPWGVAHYYNDIRRDILEDKAVENKMSGDQVIQDTFEEDKYTLYKPVVSEENFLLGTKNTITYLSSLDRVRSVMPEAPIIACIRHPFDAIASWGTTFDLLKNADVDSFPVGHPNDEFLSFEERLRLEQISKCYEVVVRRALLWRHLALLLLKYRDDILLVKYEDLVEQTNDALAAILGYVDSGRASMKPIVNERLVLRSKREALNSENVKVIENICGPVANKLGYSLV